MSPNDHEAFVLPDISEQVHRIDRDVTLSPKQKIGAARAGASATTR